MTSLPVRKSSNKVSFSKGHKSTRNLREYILYCVPTGNFAAQLHSFWEKSKEIFNGSHNYSIPHITLVSFFKAHEDPTSLVEAVKNVAEDGKHLNRPIGLELYTSNNFFGFFVQEDDANVLKRIALNFVKEISDAAISLEPHAKNLHLTLAYQFPSEKYRELLDLVENFDYSCANSWELRLYSRDPRLATKQVHRAIFPHTSREPDELELKLGDYVYVNNDASQNSPDGWTEAISYSTGNYGFIPLNHTERISETNVWALHVTVPLCQMAVPDVDEIDSSCGRSAEAEFFFNDTASFSSLQTMAEPQPSEQKCRVIVLRHGERVDFAFGSSWTTFSFNDSQKYVRMDLNMPETLPVRDIEDWKKDSPLTSLGNYQSRLVGSSLKSFGVKFTKVFVSPSLRCCQTANGVLTAMGQEMELPLNVEYGLFEWAGWYEQGLPNWMSERELGAMFNINENYSSVLSRSHLQGVMKESFDELHDRNSRTMREILKNCEGDVLIVAHATNLETCTRQLIGKTPRQKSDLRGLLMKIPYLATVCMQKVDDSPLFQLIEPPCLTLTHNSCAKFDWRILDDN